jgi:hypothetical protein
MSDRLTTLRAERDLIEGRDDWGNPALGYLNDTIEALEATERTKAPEPAPTTEPAGDPFRAVQEEMQAALARQAAGHDVDPDALIRRWNAQLADAGRSLDPGLSLERDDVLAADHRRPRDATDLAALQRQMVEAGADPGALSDAQRDALVRDYNLASPGRGTVASLRADLASDDLATRMRAAGALQRRGELTDEQASEVVDAYNAEVDAAAAAVGDPAEYPEHLRPIVEAQRQALEALEAASHRDPVDHATRVWNDYVLAARKAPPPTLAEQFAELGVQVEPEQEQVSTSTTSQEG